MWSTSIEQGADMKKLYATACLAVFFSLGFSGCYTQFSGPEPKTGEPVHRDHYYYGDPYYYWGSFCNPGFFGYPYYSYGSFYSPWWYDPWYYYGDDGRDRSGSKFLRSRDRDVQFPSAPSGGIMPPLNPPSSGGTVVRTRDNPPPPSSGKSGKQTRSSSSSGKSARRRR
jgi:hypothetical protein